MANDIETAIVDYENSMLHAICMLQLRELADKFDRDSSSDIAYLLRCVWVAAHQGRIEQLRGMIGDTVDGWIADVMEADNGE